MLVDVPADNTISVTAMKPAKPSPPSPLNADIRTIERLPRRCGGVPVVPTMSTGATDGAYLRKDGIPTYGVSGIFGDITDVRAHGKG